MTAAPPSTSPSPSPSPVEEFRVEAAAQVLAMDEGRFYDVPGKEAYEALARKVLEAAQAAKPPPPEPEIVVTEEMLDAGYEAYLANGRRTVVAGSHLYCYREPLKAAYQAMASKAPKAEAACAAEVSDEAVSAFIKSSGAYADSMTARQCVRDGLASALPHLTRHKAGTIPIKYRRRWGTFQDARYRDVENERSGKEGTATDVYGKRYYFTDDKILHTERRKVSP